MMPTKNEYWRAMRRNTGQKRADRIEYATVIELTRQGEAILHFMGEKLASKKTYQRMGHYLPAAGDRVMLINGVIIGRCVPL